MKERLALSLKGMAMGIAEVIPGVSGGTIAFITGIYEELLLSIKAIDVEFFKLFFTGKWKSCFDKLNGSFLFFLILGMLGGVLVGIFFITFLLEEYPEILWGFFFGLIAASVIYIGRQVEQFSGFNILLFIVAAIVTYGITTITPASGSESLFIVFLSGMIAICALILPGISGSFILLLLGMYSVVIPNLKELLSNPNMASLSIVVVFALGCLVGITSFSRVLTYSFKNYRDQTFALMTGIMLGSLNKIWPWRNPLTVMKKDTGNVIDVSSFDSMIQMPKELYKILKEENVLPYNYTSEPFTLLTICAVVLGFLFVMSFLFIKKS